LWMGTNLCQLIVQQAPCQRFSAAYIFFNMLIS
jgi:hypothetical protein